MSHDKMNCWLFNRYPCNMCSDFLASTYNWVVFRRDPYNLVVFSRDP